MKNETSDKQGKILSEKELEKVTGGKRETYSRLREMLGHGSTPYCEGAVGTNLNNSGTEGYPRQIVNQAAFSPTGQTGPAIPHPPRDAYSSLMKQLLESGEISEEVYAKWESSEAVDYDTFQNEQRIENVMEEYKTFCENEFTNQIVHPAPSGAEEILANLLAQEQNAMKNFPPADGDPETASEK